jgi:hypothetical protein
MPSQAGNRPSLPSFNSSDSQGGPSRNGGRLSYQEDVAAMADYQVDVQSARPEHESAPSHSVTANGGHANYAPRFSPFGPRRSLPEGNLTSGTIDPLSFLTNASPARPLTTGLDISEWSEHDLITDWPTGSTSGSGRIPGPGGLVPEPYPGQAENHLPDVSARPPIPTLLVPPSSRRVPEIPLPTGGADIQLDHVAPWSTISIIIRLYLAYSHSLFPMVHRPTFSQSLAMRRDKVDRDFRALVLGIGKSFSPFAGRGTDH